ncbi:lipoyl(octanoyl) transferase LipB [Nitratifractor salsuginis]|uniref:Octanoyltransferase n=1 Tax=Nitratifractor salsuginis (strain DSM 16511 / JCM 12458 / E9I37-1) TaxID=749222 RepID=E6X3I4_NITSE|nr:lipoyl(octanoyl) transferase LipB [Nitratifractor salsuginis]ADV46261.1 biotin/lipoate A/B protein ligase [Nitratifractor salsuginis DSM 16511]
MILHHWGLIEYEEARKQMDEVHALACQDGKNHLIFCQHPDIFTVGYDDQGSWPVPTVHTDRGGSITCHSPGQLVAYFCFQASNPALFYRRVIRAYEALFEQLNLPAHYDRQNPGFYIENRKIASLGFRYRNGVSLHGVALNVDINLVFHSQVNPCGLEGIIPTSLKAEGSGIGIEQLEQSLIRHLCEAFDEAL